MAPSSEYLLRLDQPAMNIESSVDATMAKKNKAVVRQLMKVRHKLTTGTAMPEVDFSYFLTDHIAFELIAATTRHTITANNTALGKVAVGTTWILPPTLTVQYHFFPHDRFSPYVGAGLNVSFFYGSSAAGGAVTHLSLENAVGPALQVGFDYNVSGHWFANFDVKQIFLTTTAHLNHGAIHAKTALDPLVIGAGIGYRF